MIIDARNCCLSFYKKFNLLRNAFLNTARGILCLHCQISVASRQVKTEPAAVVLLYNVFESSYVFALSDFATVMKHTRQSLEIFRIVARYCKEIRKNTLTTLKKDKSFTLSRIYKMH